MTTKFSEFRLALPVLVACKRAELVASIDTEPGQPTEEQLQALEWYSDNWIAVVSRTLGALERMRLALGLPDWLDPEGIADAVEARVMPEAVVARLGASRTLTDRQIGELLGMEPAAVRSIRRRYNIPGAPKSAGPRPGRRKADVSR